MILLCVYLMNMSLETLAPEDNVMSFGALQWKKTITEKLVIFTRFFYFYFYFFFINEGVKLLVLALQSVSLEIKSRSCILTTLVGLCSGLWFPKMSNFILLVQHSVPKLIKWQNEKTKSKVTYIYCMVYITKQFCNAATLVICLINT